MCIVHVQCAHACNVRCHGPGLHIRHFYIKRIRSLYIGEAAAWVDDVFLRWLFKVIESCDDREVHTLSRRDRDVPSAFNRVLWSRLPPYDYHQRNYVEKSKVFKSTYYYNIFECSFKNVTHALPFLYTACTIIGYILYSFVSDKSAVWYVGLCDILIGSS